MLTKLNWTIQNLKQKKDNSSKIICSMIKDKFRGFDSEIVVSEVNMWQVNIRNGRITDA